MLTAVYHSLVHEELCMDPTWHTGSDSDLLNTVDSDIYHVVNEAFQHCMMPEQPLATHDTVTQRILAN